MTRPVLKQFGDLRPDDFKEHPIWVGVHTLDGDEDWHDETTEETFRPWLEKQPVGATEMFLVSAQFTFADGSLHSGFVTPVDSYESLLEMGYMQPQIFSSTGETFRFWFGMFEPPESAAADFYQVFGKSAAQVFPVRFQPQPGLTSAIGTGEIPGFLSKPGNEAKITQ